MPTFISHDIRRCRLHTVIVSAAYSSCDDISLRSNLLPEWLSFSLMAAMVAIEMAFSADRIDGVAGGDTDASVLMARIAYSLSLIAYFTP